MLGQTEEGKVTHDTHFFTRNRPVLAGTPGTCYQGEKRPPGWRLVMGKGEEPDGQWWAEFAFECESVHYG